MALTGTARLLWALGLAFTGLPAGILLLVGTSLAGESAGLLARLDGAEQGMSQERLVSGTVRLPAERRALVAPASARRCVAWEARVSVRWTEKGSDGRDTRKSRVLRQGGAAARFDVDDPHAGLLATIEEPRLTLLRPPETRREDGVPAWADELRDAAGADPVREGRWYESEEWTLQPGEVVTFFAVPADSGSQRLTAPPGDGRLRVYLGSPTQWREEARGMASAARTVLLISRVLSAVFIGLLAALAWTWLRGRRRPQQA
ncbi:MAG: hypothetical protein IT380_17130 [Myxococcales bacterium]|nr:hypothetical protein [Myxococcales bacterium]